MSIDEIIERMKDIRKADGPNMLDGRSGDEFADLLIALAEEVKRLES